MEATLPRYCDAAVSSFRYHVCVVTEMEREYRDGPLRRVYYGHVTDCHMENTWSSPPFRRVRDARAWAEKAYTLMTRNNGVVS